MGDMADYYINQMLDEDYSPFSGKQPKGRRDKIPPASFYRHSEPKKKKVKEYPASTFDMSFFPTSIPKPVTVEPEKPVAKTGWETDGDSPF